MQAPALALLPAAHGVVVGGGEGVLFLVWWVWVGVPSWFHLKSRIGRFHKNNQYWIQLRNEGLIVAKEQGGEMISKKLGTLNGLASQTVNCFAEDHEGVVWVGTAQGLSVCFGTNSIFNGNYNADYILVETADGYVERLFENTNILDIEIPFSFQIVFPYHYFR